jgi:hypothetical protein
MISQKGRWAEARRSAMQRPLLDSAARKFKSEMILRGGDFEQEKFDCVVVLKK